MGNKTAVRRMVDLLMTVVLILLGGQRPPGPDFPCGPCGHPRPFFTSSSSGGRVCHAGGFLWRVNSFLI